MFFFFFFSLRILAEAKILYFGCILTRKKLYWALKYNVGLWLCTDLFFYVCVCECNSTEHARFNAHFSAVLNTLYPPQKVISFICAFLVESPSLLFVPPPGTPATSSRRSPSGRAPPRPPPPANTAPRLWDGVGLRERRYSCVGNTGF